MDDADRAKYLLEDGESSQDLIIEILKEQSFFRLMFEPIDSTINERIKKQIEQDIQIARIPIIRDFKVEISYDTVTEETIIRFDYFDLIKQENISFYSAMRLSI